MEESSLQLSEDDLDSLTALLFESADEDGSGEISFDELKAELEKHPGVIENLSIRYSILPKSSTAYMYMNEPINYTLFYKISLKFSGVLLRM